MSSATRATVEDLYRTEVKAELIRGRIVEYLATGDKPGQVAGNIYVALREQVKRSNRGIPYGNVGFTVPELPSGRESFSPDASYYEGPVPSNRMRFLQRAPRFAAEVRSEGDYGAEEALAEKRTDYFAAGTLVVWEVDPRAERVLVYRPTEPGQPTIYIRGQVAEAEPAVPGWRMPVDDVFWLAPGTP
jgi:Uma2 family endonuclease